MVTIKTKEIKNKINIQSEIKATSEELANSIRAIHLFFRDNYPEETLLAMAWLSKDLED